MVTQFMANHPLFCNIPQQAIPSILEQLNCRTENFKKDAILCHIGDYVQSMGVVLSGSINIENNDIWGNKNILANITPGQVFAETYACIPNEALMVTVTAAEDSQVLWIAIGKALLPSPTNPYFPVLIKNLLSIMASKNLHLTRKINHTSSKTIRGRILSYLSFQATKQGKQSFKIPFNRQQLADYLEVDRSALSNELSKMQKEGLLTYHLNQFHLNKI